MSTIDARSEASFGRVAVVVLLAAAAAACVLSPQPDPPNTGDAGDSAGDGRTGDVGGDVADAGPGDGADRDAGPDAPEETADAPDATDGADAPPACNHEDPQAPPAGIFWDPRLTGAGEETLGGHGHDDGLGAVGYCAAGPGSPRYELVSAVFQTDEDGESGGNHNIYVDVYGEPGERLLGINVVVSNGVEEWLVPTEDKPVPEATANYPMWPGNVYSCRIEGAGDEVFNMRLPNNHHVNFVLAFRRVP